MSRNNANLHCLVAGLRDAYRKLPAGERRVLLAVSGGADSTALLIGSQAVSEDLELRLAVASVDHGLRPESRTETFR
jgi:tRNA(Ile)-lysidine synthase